MTMRQSWLERLLDAPGLPVAIFAFTLAALVVVWKVFGGSR